MYKDPEIESQSWLTRLIDSPRPIVKAMALFFFLLLSWLSLVLLHAGIEHEVNSITHDKKEFWGFVYIVVSIGAISAFTCGFMLRVIVQAKYRQESKRLQDVTRMLEKSTERIKAISELKELVGQGEYLLDDEQVQRKERETDKKIIVVSVDLFFEQQEQWLDVIAGNLRKTEGPFYEYFVRDDAGNRAEEGKIRMKLLDRLNRMGVDSAATVLSSQFQVCYLPRHDFPHALFNGFAIYRNQDSARDFCLLYFPREQWRWNVDLLAGKDEAKRRAIKAIAEAEEQLELLRKKCAGC